MFFSENRKISFTSGPGREPSWKERTIAEFEAYRRDPAAFFLNGLPRELGLDCVDRLDFTEGEISLFKRMRISFARIFGDKIQALVNPQIIDGRQKAAELLTICRENIELGSENAECDMTTIIDRQDLSFFGRGLGI